VQSKEVAGEETENLGKAYMRCHNMKERSAEEAPDANVPGTNSALPLCIPIYSLLQKKSSSWITGIRSQPTTQR